MSNAWTELTRRVSEIEALTGAAGVLEWDQQTYMPRGGAVHRGQQLAVISAILHDKLTDPRLAGWLDELQDDPDPVHAAAIRNLRRSHLRAVRVPSRLVQAMAEASTSGFGAWLQAREEGRFSSFRPALQTIIELTREVAACHEDAAHPYDALLEEYEPGSSVADLDPMFDRLAIELGAFVEQVSDRPGPAPLDLHLDTPGLFRLSQRVSRALGFSMEDGRIDEAEHPFTSGAGPHDVRLTTHLYEDDLLGTLGGTIHETGHGLYEQGLDTDLAGTGLMAAASFGLHESQSRFWENSIGRSLAFCRWLVPVIKDEWPQLQLTPEQLYGAANRVQPSLIRIKADEATYNLHIIVRYQLEKAMLTGTLQAADLPQAWDAAYQRIVHVHADNPVDGVMQDVHWSSGLLGYFPSYTIGNLYAASLRRKMEQDLPTMWEQVERGEFGEILGWLRSQVHRRGHMLDAPQIFREAVGDRDPVQDLMDHLHERHGALVGL